MEPEAAMELQDAYDILNQNDMQVVEAEHYYSLQGYSPNGNRGISKERLSNLVYYRGFFEALFFNKKDLVPDDKYSIVQDHAIQLITVCPNRKAAEYLDKMINSVCAYFNYVDLRKNGVRPKLILQPNKNFYSICAEIVGDSPEDTSLITVATIARLRSLRGKAIIWGVNTVSKTTIQLLQELGYEHYIDPEMEVVLGDDVDVYTTMFEEQKHD